MSQPPGSLLATLPGRSYTDPAAFASEQEPIFGRMWFCAAGSADVAEPAQYRAVQAGRENVLVVRDRQGDAGGYAAHYYVGYGAAFARRAEGFTIDGSGGFGTLPDVRPDQDRRDFAITVRPQVFINLVPDHVAFHRMYPLRPDRTTVVCDWLFHPDVVGAGHDVARRSRCSTE